MSGDAYDAHILGMADPNHGSTAGGKIQKSISDADAGLNKVLGTLAKIERKLDNVAKKAQTLAGALGSASPGSSTSSTSTSARQNPSFPTPATSPGGTRFLPGLDNDSDVGKVPSHLTSPSGTLSRIKGNFGGVGTALAESGLQAALRSGGGLYDQDRLYTSMRLSGMVNSRSGQNGLAQQFARQFAGGYNNQDDLQAAQYALRNIGFANRNYTNQFASGLSGYARTTGMSLQDATGQYASLSQGPTQNLLRAYGIQVRGNDLSSVMKGLYAQVFARAPGGKPSKDQVETAFQVGGSAYQTAVNMGIDPAAFKDFSMAQVDPAAARRAVDQSVPGTSKTRAGQSNTTMQHGYGSRVGAANTVNGMLGDISEQVGKYLPYLANLKAVGDGLGGLGANPAGGFNVFGSAMNSLVEGMILKSLLKGGSAGGGPMSGLGGGFGKPGFGKAMGGGLAAMLGGTALTAGGSYESAHGHATAGKWMTVGGSALGMAGTGAMIGSMFAPGVGTAIGAGVGALVGGGLGLMQSGGVDSKAMGTDGAGGQTYSLLEGLAKGLGGGYAVTSTTGGKHAAHSLHYAGEAIDLGSRPKPNDPGSLLRIDQYFANKYGAHLSELIYGGPGAIRIKNGRVVNGTKDDYPASTIAEHRNHVHVGATTDMLRGAGAVVPDGSGGSSDSTSGGGGGGGIAGTVIGMAKAALSKYGVNSPWASVGNGGPGGAGGGGAVSTSKTPGAPTNPKGNVALGKQMAAALGWSGKQWDSLYALWDKESHWNNTAQNDHSTAYGIAQFLDSTWAGTGYKKTPDPHQQIAAGLKYIQSRYGDPQHAWAQSQAHNWYSKGAWRIANDKKANVHEGEMILPARIADAVRGEMSRGMTSVKGGGGGNNVAIHLTIARATDAEAEAFAMKVKRLLQDDDYMHAIAGPKP